MAGGTFTLSGKKVRPGTYINVKSGKASSVAVNLEGAVVLPLIGAKYGPAKEFIEIDASSPDANIKKLGFSVYDDDPMMLLIRETLKGCGKVYVFIPTGGTKATATIDSKLVCTAKYGGTLGNKLKVAIVANADLGTGYFNVNVYLDNVLVETHSGAQKIGDLSGVSDYIDFTPATGSTAATALTADAGTSLASGTDGSLVNADFTSMLDASETLDFNVFAFPYSATTYSALVTAIRSKVRYFNEDAGKDVFAVLSGSAADYERIINVTNGVILNDGTQITAEQAVAFVAGATAGASYTESNTYRQYPDAASVLNPKTHDQAVAAINNGEMFFSYDDSYHVVIEYDINSLVTFTSEKTEDYRKMRVQRTLDAYKKLIRANFPPNKFDNDSDGWDVMEGIGRGIHADLQEEGAIHDYNPETDFLVDRSRSEGDQTYFNVALRPTDSAEKLYFSVTTL